MLLVQTSMKAAYAAGKVRVPSVVWHRHRLWGAARAPAPKFGKRPCIYQFLPHLPPPIWVSPIIFTNLCQCILVYRVVLV